MRSRVVALALACLVAPAALSAQGTFADGKLGFAVRFRDELSSYRVLGVFAQPGEQLDLQVLQDPAREHTYRLASLDGAIANGSSGPGVADGVVPAADRHWSWRVPASPGLYPLRIVSNATGEEMLLNVFVMTPAARLRNGALEGYRIGAYPKTALRGLPAYRPPVGFVEVTAANRATPVSPHFTLGQFVCKQESNGRQFVVLRERLLLKLEAILEEVNRRGIAADTFFVMSGYRTPSYNAAIGNVRYSRHQYGDAADIFVDVSPADGVMDDLNHDGRIDVADADVLRAIVEEMSTAGWWTRFIGGLGLYSTNERHGPFIHVDARGYRARWGG